MTTWLYVCLLACVTLALTTSCQHGIYPAPSVGQCGYAVMSNGTTQVVCF